MARYVLKRILWIIPTVLGVLFIVFTINRLGPGDPVLVELGSNYTQEQYDEVEARLGLDKNFVVQFYNYVKGIVLHRDLGRSYATGRPVAREIAAKFPVTLKFGLVGSIITVLLGVPFGIVSAVKQYSLADRSVTVFALIFASMPSFWLALMMIIIFSLNLHWLPASMPTSSTIPFKYWILPCLAMGLSPVATITRITRSSMLDVVRQDYIRTARSKGQSESQIIWKHALKNALIPVITMIAIQLGGMIAGQVVLESIFSIPGIGSLTVTAIAKQDYNMIQGVVTVLATVVCVLNLIADILYGFVDPRIMAQYKSSKKKSHRAKEALSDG